MAKAKRQNGKLTKNATIKYTGRLLEIGFTLKNDKKSRIILRRDEPKELDQETLLKIKETAFFKGLYKDSKGKCFEIENDVTPLDDSADLEGL